jgi:hypothetical protein
VQLLRRSNQAGGPLLRYFVGAFGFAWIFWWLAVLEEPGLTSLPIPVGFLGPFGLPVATVAITA